MTNVEPQKDFKGAHPLLAVGALGVGINHDAASEPYYFSSKLQMYVAFEPLKVDHQVLSAAKQLGIALSWNDRGEICNISLIDGQKLLQQIGGRSLDAREYWTLYDEAIQSGNKRLLDSLTSSDFTEWLNTVFIKPADGKLLMYHQPKLEYSGDSAAIQGKAQVISQVEGRPGWFKPADNIDPNTSMPVQVDLTCDKGSKLWSRGIFKYWSTFKIDEAVGAVRGSVISSGTPSFDLDIPVTVRSPKLLLRQCRTSLPNSGLSPDLLSEGLKLAELYGTIYASQPGVRNEAAHGLVYDKRHDVVNFVMTYAEELSTTKEIKGLKVKELCIDLLGLLRLQALSRQDEQSLSLLQNVSMKFMPANQSLNYEALNDFLCARKTALREAMDKDQPIVFVIGHQNPDTDTVISCVFEAFRNQIVSPHTCFAPILQADRMPDEIQALLGQEIADSIMRWDDSLYKEACNVGSSRWLLVDHSRSEFQRFVEKIVDHHILSDAALAQDLPLTWEMVGSCAALITQKLYAHGLIPDQHCARILLGATLMDTENRGPRKMTYRDDLIMEELKLRSKEQNESALYQGAMSYLLNTDDAKRLFARDYKEDWGLFGFAVAKVKGMFGSHGEELKAQVLKELVAEAERNNKAKNFPLTLIKVVDYENDNESVRRERMYLCFNDWVIPEFREALRSACVQIIKHHLGADVKLEVNENSIDYYGVGDQLSRKVVAPILGEIVASFNRFYYSPALSRYVAREFLQLDRNVAGALTALGIEIEPDRKDRVTLITYNEAKRLVEYLGLSMLSLPEYWQVREEVHKVRDAQLSAHLESSDFVEMLDSVILDSKSLINHPQLVEDQHGISYKGQHVPISIPLALPALIDPLDINPLTGLPTKAYPPNLQGKPNFWRFWQPDAPIVVATRGYIELNVQPALDLKVHLNDALPRLGIRVCTDKITPPRVEVFEQGGLLGVRITQ